MEYEQLTIVWQNYIKHKLSESKVVFSEEVIVFFQHASVDFLDIEELDYLEYGQILVRFLDLVYEDEEVEIRFVESLEDGFEAQWGYMGKDDKKHFDMWLKKRFSLDDKRVSELLSWTESFLRAVLKKRAE